MLGEFETDGRKAKAAGIHFDSLVLPFQPLYPHNPSPPVIPSPLLPPPFKTDFPKRLLPKLFVLFPFTHYMYMKFFPCFSCGTLTYHFPRKTAPTSPSNSLRLEGSDQYISARLVDTLPIKAILDSNLLLADSLSIIRPTLRFQ